MDEELPKGVTTQQTPDGRTSVWFFPMSRLRVPEFLLSALIATAVFPLFLFELAYLGHLLRFSIGFGVLAFLWLLVLAKYLFQKRTKIAVSGVAIYKDSPFSRRGFAWGEVSSLYVRGAHLYAILVVKDEQGNSIELCLGSYLRKNRLRTDSLSTFLYRLVTGKYLKSVDRKLEEILKKEGAIRVATEKSILHRSVAARITFYGFLLGLIFLSVAGIFSPCIVYFFLAMAFPALLITWNRIKGRKIFIVASKDKLYAALGKEEFRWDEIEKVECQSPLGSNLRITSPLKIWFSGEKKPLVIPPGADNYNLLVALLKHKKFI